MRILAGVLQFAADLCLALGRAVADFRGAPGIFEIEYHPGRFSEQVYFSESLGMASFEPIRTSFGLAHLHGAPSMATLEPHRANYCLRKPDDA